MPLRQKDLADLPPGKYHDSGRLGTPGLILLVKPTGTRSFVCRLSIAGKRVEIGIGSLRDTPLSLARERALKMRQRVRDGEDPRRDRATAIAAATTFGEIFEEACQAREAASDGKHVAQWRNSVEQHALPTLGKVPIGQIDAALIADALTAIWKSKPETGRRVLQRIGTTLELARAKGLFHAPSPLPAVRVLLGKQGDTVKHFEAMPLGDLPKFMKRLAALKSPSARALEFTIMTAARSKPTRLLESGQIEGAVWTAPAENMKGGRAHRTPLSTQALATLAAAKRFNGKPYLFAGNGGKTPLSEMAMAECLKGLAPGVTVHGFRSCFNDWCRREGVAHDLQERALAHIEEDKTRRAYARDDLLAERAPVMQAWADFICGG